MEAEPIEPHDALPDGEYAFVEFLGHRTLVGRIEEVERFGSKMLQVEALFEGKLLSAAWYGSGSIYAVTPLSKAQALRHAPTARYQLPGSVQKALPGVETSEFAVCTGIDYFRRPDTDKEEDD